MKVCLSTKFCELADNLDRLTLADVEKKEQKKLVEFKFISRRVYIQKL